jgi:hypothetical protein
MKSNNPKKKNINESKNNNATKISNYKNIEQKRRHGSAEFRNRNNISITDKKVQKIKNKERNHSPEVIMNNSMEKHKNIKKIIVNDSSDKKDKLNNTLNQNKKKLNINKKEDMDKNKNKTNIKNNHQLNNNKPNNNIKKPQITKNNDKNNNANLNKYINKGNLKEDEYNKLKIKYEELEKQNNLLIQENESLKKELLYMTLLFSLRGYPFKRVVICSI